MGSTLLLLLQGPKGRQGRDGYPGPQGPDGDFGLRGPPVSVAARAKHLAPSRVSNFSEISFGFFV